MKQEHVYKLGLGGTRSNFDRPNHALVGSNSNANAE